MARASSILVAAVLVAAAGVAVGQDLGARYSWLAAYDAGQSVCSRIAVPAGARRVSVEAGSFGEWLRNLPLKPGRPAVMLFNGEEKGRQYVHAAVIDIDVGNRDLQQCADAVIRLRAEYLFASGRRDEISFNFTSGDPARYADWTRGLRPAVSGNNVRWTHAAEPGDDYAGFRKYLDTVFTFAGTLSLSRELRRVPDVHDVRPGDVFIEGGSPGHAVIVIDVAESESGGRFFLLAQSYMPAQEIHLLVNPSNAGLSPWYEVRPGVELLTPEWTFDSDSLMRSTDVEGNQRP